MGDQAFWRGITDTPYLSKEAIVDLLHRCGCVNPGETTSASVAAAAIVAQYGPMAVTMISAAELKAVYESVKVGARVCTWVMMELAVTTASLMESALMIALHPNKANKNKNK